MGWVLGLIAGSAEYAFLKMAVCALAAEHKAKAAVMMLCNVVCLAAALTATAVFWQSQLLPCGLAMTGALIVLSVGYYWMETQKKKEENAR